MSSGRNSSTVDERTGYIGRFAPSPTGSLHLGSLLTAVGSFLDARHHQGKWLLRIEDIDPPRTVAGAAAAIQQSLERHGLLWDGPCLLQSTRQAAYDAALAQLARHDELFYCACSRLALAAHSGRYPGTCRARRVPFTSPDSVPTRHENAVRLQVQDIEIQVTDLLQGGSACRPAQDIGDFVVRRKEGFIAYQLAVVVDDAFQGVTHVVRGADLLDNTARQQYLQQRLGLPTPRYLHLPVLVDSHAEKLSKRAFAASLDATPPRENLVRVLAVLGHTVPPPLLGATPSALLEWATEAWQRTAIPRMLALPITSPAPASIPSSPVLRHRPGACS